MSTATSSFFKPSAECKRFSAGRRFENPIQQTPTAATRLIAKLRNNSEKISLNCGNIDQKPHWTKNVADNSITALAKWRNSKLAKESNKLRSAAQLANSGKNRKTLFAIERDSSCVTVNEPCADHKQASTAKHPAIHINKEN